MRIANNTISDTTLRQIQNLTGRLTKYQTQVSTGQRIARPEDDPAAVGRIMDLQAEQQQLAQYEQNASRALEISQASSSALTDIKKVSDRASEIATLGSSTESASGAASYATETNQLLEQAVLSANSTLRGTQLFGGTATDTAPFQVTRDATGNITGVSYTGSPTTASVSLSDSTSISPYSSIGTNQGLADFLNHLVSLRDALQSNNLSAVATTATGLQTTEDTIINAISEQGAVQSRIQVNQDQMQTRATNLEKLVSSDRDVDMSQAIVRLNQVQVAYQASLQSTTTIMSKSLLDYL